MKGPEGRRGHGGESKHVYKMHENSFPSKTTTGLRINGKQEFYVDGKALSWRETFILKDLQGNDLYKIQERLLKIRDTMDIIQADDGVVATVKKALISIM
jgi:uncharacterized protein YxjI